MSHSIVKKVLFKNDGVYIASASNNVYPRRYDEFRSDYYSELLRAEGFKAVVKLFAAGMHDGTVRFLKGNKFCNCMLAAKEEIDAHRDVGLSRFLNNEAYSSYITESVMAKYMNEPFTERSNRIEKLLAMRKDPESVFNMCKENAGAFFYADSSIQSNKELCRRYVKEFAENLMFHIPSAVREDKEAVMMAVSSHGCAFRDLPASMRDDPDVVLAAFGAKKYPEHLPDLISPRLQNEVELMGKVIDAEPRIHFSRSPIMMSNPNIALKIAEKAEYIYGLGGIPENIRSLPKIQRAMAARLHDLVPEDQKERRLQILSQVVEPKFLVPEQLKNAAGLEYKGIVFDDFAIDASGDGGGVWAEMCQCCAEKYKDLLSDELDDAGAMGACSVDGCGVVGADCEYEHHYYVDFKIELIQPLSLEQLLEKEGVEVLEYEPNAKERFGDLFDVASPQECANMFGKPVKDGDKIYMPQARESAEEAALHKPSLAERIDAAASKSREQSVGKESKEKEPDR